MSVVKAFSCTTYLCLVNCWNLIQSTYLVPEPSSQCKYDKPCYSHWAQPPTTCKVSTELPAFFLLIASISQVTKNGSLRKYFWSRRQFGEKGNFDCFTKGFKKMIWGSWGWFVKYRQINHKKESFLWFQWSFEGS